MTIEKFRKWLKGLEWDDEFMRAVRSEVGSRNAKRATPHAGPGRPKGGKNKKGHKAGRPKKV